MTDFNLTQNFKLSEFTKTDLTPYQIALIQLLANNLQKVRDYLQQFKVDQNKIKQLIDIDIVADDDV